MSGDENNKLSKFNSGVAMSIRIDSLQTAMNMARFNPLMFNVQFGVMNYEVMISSQDALLEEAWAKLNEKERKEGERIKNVVHNFITYNPIIKNNHKGEQIIDNKNYQKFMQLIDIYAKANKVFLDSHNLNSPDSEDDSGL